MQNIIIFISLIALTSAAFNEITKNNVDLFKYSPNDVFTLTEDVDDDKPPVLYNGEDTKAKTELLENYNAGKKFKYQLKTQNGIDIQQAGKLKDDKTFVVSGQYSFTGVDGKRYKTRYTADELGYHPMTELDIDMPEAFATQIPIKETKFQFLNQKLNTDDFFIKPISFSPVEKKPAVSSLGGFNSAFGAAGASQSSYATQGSSSGSGFGSGSGTGSSSAYGSGFDLGSRLGSNSGSGSNLASATGSGFGSGSNAASNLGLGSNLGSASGSGFGSGSTSGYGSSSAGSTLGSISKLGSNTGTSFASGLGTGSNFGSSSGFGSGSSAGSSLGSGSNLGSATGSGFGSGSISGSTLGSVSKLGSNIGSGFGSGLGSGSNFGSGSGFAPGSSSGSGAFSSLPTSSGSVLRPGFGSSSSLGSNSVSGFGSGQVTGSRISNELQAPYNSQNLGSSGSYVSLKGTGQGGNAYSNSAQLNANHSESGYSYAPPSNQYLPTQLFDEPARQ